MPLPSEWTREWSRAMRRESASETAPDDGASAIYGTGAIGGIVNFVLDLNCIRPHHSCILLPPDQSCPHLRSALATTRNGVAFCAFAIA